MLCRKEHTFYLATTRFNPETWQQNETYREKHALDGCLYGTPIRIARRIPIDSYMFILEMKNLPRNHKDSPGRIMGIGYIKNHVDYRVKHSIYKDRNYNRYCYKSDYRIDRCDLLAENKEMLEMLETLVFRGYSHLKRGQGITCVPEKKLSNKKLRIKIKKFIMNLFMKTFVS